MNSFTEQIRVRSTTDKQRAALLLNSSWCKGWLKVCNRCTSVEDLDYVAAENVRFEKYRYCMNCRKVCYCSKACQKADWPNHKSRCHKSDATKEKAGKSAKAKPKKSCSTSPNDPPTTTVQDLAELTADVHIAAEDGAVAEGGAVAGEVHLAVKDGAVAEGGAVSPPPGNSGQIRKGQWSKKSKAKGNKSKKNSKRK